MHPEARDVHKDGSPKNVCKQCIHFGNERPLGNGWCSRHNHGNMWFGNCDDWWPDAENRNNVFHEGGGMNSGIMKRAVGVLRERLPLRAGYYVKLDKKTDNIIIANERLGFCITKHYVEDNPETYLESAQIYLAQLVNITDRLAPHSATAPFYTPQEMNKQAER